MAGAGAPPAEAVGTRGQGAAGALRPRGLGDVHGGRGAAPDQPGLAYTLAHTLSGLGLDIRFARIATEKALALDVFYVTDAEGRKLAPEAAPEVEEALLTAFGTKRRTRSLSKEA